MDLTALAQTAGDKYGIRPALILADIQHESGGNPFAIGDGGLAIGLMQVHSAACSEMGNDWNALKAAIDAKDEETAAQLGIDFGCAYLAKCIKERGGDEAWGLGSYNQGETVIGLAHRYATAVLALAPKDSG